MDYKKMIENGDTFLGIELGSTRIKAVLIASDFTPIASGNHDWENRLSDGVWTYDLKDVWAGIQDSFQNLAESVKMQFGVPLTTVGAMGVSAMMHGYLAFDKDDNLLVPFRTWRNTTTEQAANELTRLFDFNVPQRWSIAHLYQAILNKESHVPHIAFLTTLAGYVHWRLTGEKVLGIGDASGMFPIENAGYNPRMITQVNALTNGLAVDAILPRVLNAGEVAGKLTNDGAKLLDPTGVLKPGIPLCPPEGDAGTGMVATNSVVERTGNISAGTSVFTMIVLEKELSKVYVEVDMVTTPAGKPVAMVHCNNCTSDLDAWVKLFGETLEVFGKKPSVTELYETLYKTALSAESDCGGLLSYNYLSGEPITNLDQGRPLFVRMPDARFNLGNFMRNLLFSAIGTLKLGMDILTEKEDVQLEQLLGHGGFFKTKGVGQRLMAAALNVPVSVMESAGEGGAWGIALLAAYLNRKNETLEEFLANQVFASAKAERVTPDPNDSKGFDAFMIRYKQGLPIMKSAIESLEY